MAEDFAGARVRFWRQKRGLSQRTLADLVGVSQGYVSQVESGLKEIDKRSTLVRFAEALQVAAADLTGQPFAPRDAMHARAVAAVPEIRASLIGLAYRDLPSAPARGLDELAADVRQLMVWRESCDYASAARLLAPLLQNLAVAVHGPRTVDREEALRLLALTTYTAAFVLKYLGYADLSLSAAERCHDIATELEAPQWVGLAEFARLHTLPPENRSIGRRLAAVTADALQRDLRSANVRQTYGMLHLSSAWSEAVAGAHHDAAAHLDEAADIAASLGGDPPEGGFARMHFGPTNLQLWRVSLALESGEHGKAVQLARSVDTEKVVSTSRLASFHVDVGSALAAGRRHDAEALAQFIRAERIAPQRVRLSPVVRDTVGSMLRRARADAGGAQLREMAGRLGVA
jgi:transcriptional regulator with XRE-family HTH domain